MVGSYASVVPEWVKEGLWFIGTLNVWTIFKAEKAEKAKADEYNYS